MSVERRVLAVAVLATAMAFVDVTALNTALPALQTALSASPAQLLWIVNAYGVPLTALLLAAGALGDLHGRRRVFAFGIGLFAAASLMCGVAPSAGALVAARAVQGAGAALMIPGSLALIAAAFPPERLGRAIGTWSALSVVAMAAGPIVGGALAARGLWRGVFLLNLPVALTALALLARVPESRGAVADTRFDFAGAVLAVTGLFGLSYAGLAAPERGLADARVLAALALGLAALVAFVLVEARSARPMLPLALFRARELAVPSVVTMLLYTAFHGWMVFVPLHLVRAQGYDELQAGLAQLPLLLLLVLASPLAGRLFDRNGARVPLAIGTALATLGFLAFRLDGLESGPGEYATRVLPSFVALGAGLGLCIAPLSTLVITSVGRERFALASGINSTLSRLAGIVAVVLFGALGSASDAEAVFSRRALLAAALSVAAALVVLTLPRRC